MIYPDGLLRCYMLGHHLRYHQRTLWFLMQPCKLFQRFDNLLQYLLLKSSLVLLKHTLWPLHDILLHGILCVRPSLVLQVAHFMVSPVGLSYPYCSSCQPVNGAASCCPLCGLPVIAKMKFRYGFICDYCQIYRFFVLVCER